MVPRRTYLAATGGIVTVLLAGYIPRDETETRDGPSNEEKSANITPADGFPAVSIEADESAMEHAQLSAELVRQFDGESPARVRITFRNDSSEQREFIFGATQPFYGLNAEHPEKDGWLTLQPVGKDGPQTVEEPIDGCWQLDPPAMFDVAKRVVLEPNESLANDYDIYAGSQGDCLVEGTYRFEDSAVGEIGHHWGFTLTITSQEG